MSAVQPACAAAPSPGKPSLCIPKDGTEQFVIGLPEEHGWERGDWATVSVAQPGMTNSLPIALAVITEPQRDVARVSVLYQRGERGLDGGRVRRVGKEERARLGKFVARIARIEGDRVRLDVGAEDDARMGDIYEIRSAQDSSRPIARVRVTELEELHLWATPLDHAESLKEGLTAVYSRSHEPGEGEQRPMAIVVASFTPTREQDAEEARVAEGYAKELANALTSATAGMEGVSVQYAGSERVQLARSDAEAHAEARSIGKRHGADVVVWGATRCREMACAQPRVTVVDPDQRHDGSDEAASDSAGITLVGAAATNTAALAASILGSAAFSAQRYADASYHLHQAVSEKTLGTEDEFRARRSLSRALSARGQTAAARAQASSLMKRAREQHAERWEQLGHRELARIDEQEGHVASPDVAGVPVAPPSTMLASLLGAAASAHDLMSGSPATARALHATVAPSRAPPKPAAPEPAVPPPAQPKPAAPKAAASPSVPPTPAAQPKPAASPSVPPTPAAQPKPAAPPKLPVPRIPDRAAGAVLAVRPGGAPERPWQRPAGLVAMGVGLAGLGAGAVLGGLAVAKNSESNDTHCDAEDRCDAAGVALRHEAVGLGNASTVAMIAGGVLLGGGAALFFTAPPSAKAPDRANARTARWSARFEILPGGVQVRGAWR